MNKSIFLAAALCLPAIPSLADVTSAEIWDVAQEALADFIGGDGTLVSVDVGTETAGDDGLFLSDVAIVVDQLDTIVTINMDWIKLQDISDGTVEITFNPITNIQIKETSDFDDNTTVTVTVTVDVIQSGYLARVAGNIDNYTVDVTTNYVKIFVPVPSYEASEKGSFNMLLQGIAARSEISSDVSNLFSDVAVAIDSISTTAYFEGTRPTFNFDDMLDEEPVDRLEIFTSTSEIRDLRISAQEEENELNHEITSFEEVPDMQFLASISGADMTLSYSGYNWEGIPNSADMVASIGEMRSILSITSGKVSAEAVMQELLANVDLDTIEVTDVFDVSLDEAGYRLNVDIDMENGRAEASYLENIDNLLLSSSFWDLFDPEITIPRDPISSVMDVTGELLMDPDNLDVENLEEASTGVFKTLHVTLNQYLLSGAGVRIEVTGEADMDMDGINLDFDEPKMSASMHIDLQGGFDLIGKLLELDIIPADIAFGARTIIGMVGIREDGDDHFVSDVSIDENGDLTVNGKPFEIPN